MIQVIDLIQTDDLDATKLTWGDICKFFSKQPGYVDGHLFETFETVHPTADYKLTSFCQWESDEAWQKARQAAKNDQRLAKLVKSLPAQFTAFRSTLDNGDDRRTNGHDHHNMILVDVICLEKQRMGDYANMWKDARSYMMDKPGYVSASLYRSHDIGSQIKFINIAEWQSPETFFAALKTPEFFSIIDEYKNNFSLYLSNKWLSIQPNDNAEPERVERERIV